MVLLRMLESIVFNRAENNPEDLVFTGYWGLSSDMLSLVDRGLIVLLPEKSTSACRITKAGYDIGRSLKVMEDLENE